MEQKHLTINQNLAKQVNKLSMRFNNGSYSSIENIDKLLLKRDISIEKKKNILIRKLHAAIIAAFSIDMSKFRKSSLESLKKRLYNIRRIIIKLRSINYHLETAFFEDLKLSKIDSLYKKHGFSMLSKTKIRGSLKSKQENALTTEDLEALEFTTYKLIREVIILDKKLLNEYSNKEEKILKKEKVDIKDLDLILRKESEILEHLEAKLPPPRLVSIDLIKEPIFTNWVSRVFALLSYIGYIYTKETMIFSKLKKDAMLSAKISKKIEHLVIEKSKLIKIMEEKSVSMKKFTLNSGFRKKLHNFTTAISV